VYTTRAFADREPETLRRYASALVEAQRFTAENPEDAKRILVDAMGYDPGFVNFMWPRWNFVMRLDQGMVLTMEDQARWMMAEGVVPERPVPNYLDSIHFDALEFADPAAVGLVH
jgi:NitT/TauT family transport system substrate-binding protein